MIAVRDDGATLGSAEVSDMANEKKHHNKQPHLAEVSSAEDEPVAESDRPLGMKRKQYEHEMRLLHAELVGVQKWVKSAGAKICVVFEGRDTAGKGGHRSNHGAGQPPAVPGRCSCPPRRKARSPGDVHPALHSRQPTRRSARS